MQLHFFAISLAAVYAAPISRKVEPFGPTFKSFTVDGPLLQDFTPMLLAAGVDDAFKIPDDPAMAAEYIATVEPAIISFVQEKFKVDVKVQSSYNTFSSLSHFYLQQYFGGLPIVNGLAAIHLDMENRDIAYFTQSFEFDPVVGTSNPRLESILRFDNEHQNFLDEAQGSAILSKEEAFQAFVSYLGFDDFDDDLFFAAPMSLKYMRTKDQGLRLVWDIELDLDTNWFNVQIDAETGSVLMLVDWVSHASFEVFPVGYNDPRDGPRKLVVDPEHPVASPYGWNSFTAKNNTTTKNTDTQGNNVYAQDNPNGRSDWSKNHRPKGTNGAFTPALNLTKEPKTYIDAAIVNLFYWNNIIHDLFYVYGFTETAGNFQENNYHRGSPRSKDKDAVIANAQDGSGTNNANFATPPDGSHGRMRMYIWTQTRPARDGDLESGIIIHEYAHGISTRLTGGPANSGCLGWGEAGGMGEGWGDWFATILRMDSNTTRHDNFGMGDYSAGGRGIRRYSYSTNNKTNPSTYSFVRLPGYWGVHAKGEVWAEILYEFFWDLVDKHGWEDDYFNVPLKKSFFPDPTAASSDDGAQGKERDLIPYLSAVEYPKAGNKLALRLVVDGLKFQPCSPSFVDARDAILQADKIGTRGQNQCGIWASFARRGLGVDAVAGGRENFDIPEECEA